MPPLFQLLQKDPLLQQFILNTSHNKTLIIRENAPNSRIRRLTLDTQAVNTDKLLLMRLKTPLIQGKCCDFVLFYYRSRQLHIYFFEIKTSVKKGKGLNAYTQCQATQKILAPFLKHIIYYKRYFLIIPKKEKHHPHFFHKDLYIYPISVGENGSAHLSIAPLLGIRRAHTHKPSLSASRK